MDLAERLEALQARNEEPMEMPGVPYTDDEAKAAFLDLLSRGNTLTQAAEKAQRSVTWFRRKRNPNGNTYDREFTEAFEQIMAPDGGHIEALVQNARAALIAAAEKGNVRAIEKILATYDADFGWMKAGNSQGTWNVEQLQVFFGELPLSKLLELKEARQQERMKELPVVDQ